MQEKNFPEIFINWYRSYLKYRTVTINQEGVKVKRVLTRGTPQGGLLSPLAWNLAFESLLQTLSKGQVKICGFADDACLIATGESPLLLRFLMQDAIGKAFAWGRSRGLQFSGQKKVAVLFTHKRVFRKPPLLKVGDTEPPYSTCVCYLGVELDSKLSWKRHVFKKIRIAKLKLMHVKPAIGKLWGPSPKIPRWAYSSIIRSALTYGCHVWARAITDKSIASSLVRVNRLAQMLLGNFRIKTPTVGLGKQKLSSPGPGNPRQCSGRPRPCPPRSRCGCPPGS